MKTERQKRKSKTRVGVIFGGRSAEHQVSLVSASSVIGALDRRKYEVVPIGITPDGRWYSSPDILDLLKKGERIGGNVPQYILLPDPSKGGLVQLSGNDAGKKCIGLDVIFPVLHGTYGEDGSLQGLLELTSIPYVGSGVLGSSAGMDKAVTKQLCQLAGIPVVPYLYLFNKYFRKNRRSCIRKIEAGIGYPCFIKPVNLGSSVGISKAASEKELAAAIGLAASYDNKILIEKSVEDAREIEISVLGNDEPSSSVPGEIVSSNEFYDYDAKYVDGLSKSIIPAKLPPAVVREIKNYAVSAFTAVGCSGMARVDFLVVRRSNRIFLNELNTIPGFTSISMYPKLWEASGLPYPALLDRLIALAFDKHAEKFGLKTDFKPKKAWYR